MFLNTEQIRDRLSKGDLVIDPIIEETQVASFTVDLRLGTEFIRLPSPQVILHEKQPTQEATNEVILVELGQSIQIPPGAGLIGSTLEYLKIPVDLAGLLFSRAAWARVGVVTTTLTVDPGFQGKLVLPIFNHGNMPVILQPGIRIMQIGFGRVESSLAFAGAKYVHSVGPSFTFGRPQPDKDLEMLKARIAERDQRLTSTYTPKQSMKQLLNQTIEATGTSKGKVLEEFATEVFHTIQGLQIISRNQRLMAEEFDLYLQNNIDEGFWRFLGSPIIVECKNWSKKVGAREISILFDKLASVGPDAKTAILIAPLGVSGDEYADALAKIREKRQAGRYIIVLDQEALEDIASGVQATKVIERCYVRILII
jgi:dCTP deaminase